MSETRRFGVLMPMSRGFRVSSCTLLGALVAVLLASAAAARGHPPVSTVVRLEVAPSGGVTVTIVHDALAFALEKTSAEVSDAEMQAFLRATHQQKDAAFLSGRERLLRGTELNAGGVPVVLDLRESPSTERLWEWVGGGQQRSFPCTMSFVLAATLPSQCTTVTVRVPVLLGNVLLAIDRPGLERSILPLDPGEASPPIDVSMVRATRDATSTKQAVSRPLAPGGVPRAGDGTAADAGTAAVAWRYVRLGFDHIVPEGTDHALFVLGLFLLTPRVKPLLWQITAFTLAHSVTLTLATLRLVSVPGSVVEPVIALSIAFIAVENLCTTKIRAWRPLVAFMFGLVHGLGFASGLMEIGLPTRQLATGLIAFNVGVEGGHISVLLVAFALLGWARARPWYRARVVLPLSVVIAGIALLWSIDRVWSAGEATAPEAAAPMRRGPNAQP